MKHTRSVLSLLPLVLAACGDGSTGTTPGDAAIELVGVWDDNFGGTTTIAAATWGDQAIIAWDNTRNEAITQNPPSAMFSPNAFSKQLWTEPAQGVWYTCTVAYGKATRAEAEAVAAVPFVSPTEKNCGTFTWTQMSVAKPKIEVIGVWQDNFGSPPLTISAQKWGSQAIISFDNALREAITQNPPDDMFGPNKFSKVLWTKPDASGWYTCTIGFGKDTAPEAAAVPSVPFVNAMEKNCGGFTWSQMTAK